MASQLEICNAALAQVGEAMIGDIAETSRNGELCRLFLPLAVREVLRVHPWRCVQKAANLSQLTAAPLAGWARAYALPNDFVRLVRFNDRDADDITQTIFEVVGRAVYTNDLQATAIYVSDVELTGEYGLMDGALTDCVVKAMAIKLSWPVQQSGTLRPALEASLKDSLAMAVGAERAESYRTARRANDPMVDQVLALLVEESGTINPPTLQMIHAVETILPGVIREVLRRGTWRCARKRVVLGETAAPAFKWAHAFALPVDFIRLVSFNDTDPDTRESVPFEIVGAELHTDATSAAVVYVADYSSIGLRTLLNPFIAQVIILTVAARVGMKNADLRVALEKRVEGALESAMAAEGREEESSQVRSADPLVREVLDVLASEVGALDAEAIELGRVVPRLLPVVAREILALGRWRCARKAVTLSASVNAPVQGWTYAYALPTDFVRLVSLNDLDPDDPQLSFHEILGNELQTDEATAAVVYVADIGVNATERAKMDPLLRKAVVASTAAKAAGGAEKTRALVSLFEDRAQRAVREARAADARGEYRETMQQSRGSRWIRSRF